MFFPRFALDAVNRASSTLDGAAGKSINVAKVLQALGEHPMAVGFLGGDRGRQLEQIVRARGIQMDFVSVDAPTRQCLTVIDQASGAITELVEESRPVEAAAYERLLAIVRKHLPQCRAMVLSGTIASGGPPDLYYQCVCLARDAGVLSIADASGPALIETLRANPGLVKPNRAELEATVGSELANEDALRAAMNDLHQRGAQRVVVTAGNGPVVAFDGSRFYRLLAPKVQAVNPIGSGDAFTAGLTWQLLRGASLSEACRWAVAAGAANALTPMAGEVDRLEVKRLVDQVRLETL